MTDPIVQYPCYFLLHDDGPKSTDVSSDNKKGVIALLIYWSLVTQLKLWSSLYWLWDLPVHWCGKPGLSSSQI